ncbi:MAG TPA: response regulator [Vicinamibacterales bacterium]|nr:response regulator [Vicinamibacterales bacterium]
MTDELRDGIRAYEQQLTRPTDAPAGPKPLILLVEDMLDARELYAEYLTFAGFSVVTAINGHEAVGLAQLLRPDLILMDIRLPGMDGLEATADIRRNPDLRHIPIVAITADPSDEIGESCREAGCTSFLNKPVLPDVVAQHIRAVLAAGAGSGTR